MSNLHLSARGLRRMVDLLMLTGLCGAGCSSTAPPPAESPAPAAKVTSEPAGASAPPPIAQPSSASQTHASSAPAATAGPAVDPTLRALAARLVVSDGHGGWRRDEQAATDLEKLGPGGPDHLWPL